MVCSVDPYVVGRRVWGLGLGTYVRPKGTERTIGRRINYTITNDFPFTLVKFTPSSLSEIYVEHSFKWGSPPRVTIKSSVTLVLLSSVDTCREEFRHKVVRYNHGTLTGSTLTGMVPYPFTMFSLDEPENFLFFLTLDQQLIMVVSWPVGILSSNGPGYSNRSTFKGTTGPYVSGIGVHS